MTKHALHRFPILKHFWLNRITKSIYEMIPGFKAEESARVLFDLNFNFFVYRDFFIHYFSPRLHKLLCQNQLFYRDSSLLAETADRTGLLLLPQSISLECIGRNSVLVNTIFYSWLSHHEHFKIAGLTQAHQAFTIQEGKSLLILPISNDCFIQDIDLSRLYCRDIDYCKNRPGAYSYSALQDYVLSAILLNSFPEVYDEVLAWENLNRKMVQLNTNQIELVL